VTAPWVESIDIVPRHGVCTIRCMVWSGEDPHRYLLPAFRGEFSTSEAAEPEAIALAKRTGTHIKTIGVYDGKNAGRSIQVF
jgi:hypothetical protein